MNFLPSSARPPSQVLVSFASTRGRVWRLSPQGWNNAPALRFELYGQPLYRPLGLTPNAATFLADTALSASSTFSPYLLKEARFSDAYLGWAATSNVAANEWFQVNLGTSTRVEAVALMSHKALDWRVTSYNIQVSNDSASWTTITNAGVPVVFTGPSAMERPARVVLPSPVITQYVRYVSINRVDIDGSRFCDCS
jgi:hypothetical protein